jgi:hypothetical protein
MVVYNIILEKEHKIIFIKNVGMCPTILRYAPRKYYYGKKGAYFIYDIMYPGLELLVDWINTIPEQRKVTYINNSLMNVLKTREAL